MLDHLPILTLLRQTRINNKSPLIFESRNLNGKKQMRIKQALFKIDWINALRGKDCNENFNIFTDIMKKLWMK